MGELMDDEWTIIKHNGISTRMDNGNEMMINGIFSTLVNITTGKTINDMSNGINR